jgi:arylsulfatase
VSDTYETPFKFTGKIMRVTIDLKAVQKGELEDAAQAVRAAALKKGLSD